MYKKSLYILTVLIVNFMLVSNIWGTVVIKPDNPNLHYTGRIDFSVPDKPVMYWPGTYVKAKFEGSVLIISLDDQTGNSFYNVYIDEDYNHPYLINCNVGSSIYVVSGSLKDTVHTMLLFRRTEASTGPTKFLGLQIDNDKNILPLQNFLTRKILFYGDSITCGMGNEAPDSYPDDNLAYENNFLAYGAIASRLINADYICIAKSGIGIMISWFNLIMPNYYYRLNPDDANSQWDYSSFIPDVVVINLFQNDSWLIGNLNPKPDSTKIINSYMDFIRLVRAKHPSAFLVCSLGSMDATKSGSLWPCYIEKAVKNLKTTDNDSNIGTYFFAFDPAWTKHPRVRHHQKMGQELASYISTKMGWTTDVNDNFNLQLPASFSLSQNYPNPFNPTTTIEYKIDKPDNVKIIIYDLLGREVSTLVNSYKTSGSYKEIFDASKLSAGVYYYQLISGKNIETKSMVLLK